MINSECGNVWGYEGSTGDVDWTWDYHIMMNEFRSHPKVAGWLYTEHHDVINEWNGYVRFDRSAKITGLDSIMSSMTLNDLHSPVYLAPQLNLCADVDPGARVDVPLWLSVMTEAYKNTSATIETEVLFFDRLGNKRTMGKKTFSGYSINAWESKAVKPIQVELPHEAGLAVLMLRLKENNGKVLQSNFTTFKMGQSTAPRDEKIVVGGERYRVLRFAPQSFTDSKWSKKQWNVLNGLKVNGAGAGYFEYTINIPKDLDLIKVKEATFKFEASAKQLFGKDLNKTASKADLDFMLGGGDHDPSKNPNSYPMTDTKRFPSKVKILINGEEIATATLPDDPADHQGILSWNAQPKDKKLHEAGSYGYLITAKIPASVLANAKGNKLTIQLKVDESLPGGLAIYGENFGRYPIDPMLIFKL